MCNYQLYTKGAARGRRISHLVSRNVKAELLWGGGCVIDSFTQRGRPGVREYHAEVSKHVIY